MKKRFLTLLIVFALLCALPFQAIALTDNEGPNESIDTILLKEIDVDPAVKNVIVDKFLAEANFELQETDIVILSKNYIQISREQNDGSIQSTLISGFNENNIVNFDVLAKEITRASWTATSHPYYDFPEDQNHQITFSFTFYFFRARTSAGYRFYRPYELSASYAPTSGNTVSNLTGHFIYISSGWLIKSPECLNENNTYNDLAALVLNTDYQHDIRLDITSPLAPNSTVYHMNSMPGDTAIWFANLYSDGSSLEYAFQYTCNNNNYVVLVDSIDMGNDY